MPLTSFTSHTETVAPSTEDTMPRTEAFISNPWIWYNDEEKTPTQKFFEAYANAVNTRTFGEASITRWYAPSIVTRSETLKEFHGAQAMADWMRDLLIPFERINHIPETYLEYTNPDGTVCVHARFLRQLWLKGNTSDEPEPAETEDGYNGLQWKELQLFWDKTKLVSLFGKLPSDK